ncbi:MAG: hypothetical protein ACLTSZ_06375 [Lachnospiraceae bacterium]
MFFSADYSSKVPEEMQQILSERLRVANIPSMVITMGGDGSVYADMHGNRGFCPAKKVDVPRYDRSRRLFCAGVVSGLTYGKTLTESLSRSAPGSPPPSSHPLKMYVPAVFTGGVGDRSVILR